MSRQRAWVWVAMTACSAPHTAGTSGAAGAGSESSTGGASPARVASAGEPQEIAAGALHSAGSGPAATANAGSAGAATASLSCPAGLLLCNDSCVDVAVNPLHCGNCGQRCVSDEQCVGGSCWSAAGGTAGAPGTGGQANAGGEPSTGGAATGGVPTATGGTGTGGDSTGGVTATGGATGGFATGGDLTTGGVEATGGAGTGGAEPEPWETVTYTLSGTCAPDPTGSLAWGPTDDFVFRSEVPHDGLDVADCTIIASSVERCSDGDCYIREREADCTVIWEDYPDVYYAVNVRCNSPGATGTMTATVVVEQQQRPLLGD